MRTTFAIPCRNGAAHLPALLRSLLAQTRPDAELLLVDDASTDGSVAVARAVAGDRLRVVVNAAALGMAGNWNRCAELVRTEFFCLAHMDDVYRPTWRERLEDALLAAPAAAAAHCRAEAIDAEGRPVPSPAEAYKDRFWTPADLRPDAASFQRLWRGNFVVCPSVLFRTEVFRADGPFDGALHFAPDWALWLRLLLADRAIVGVPERLVAYRRHEGSATRVHARSCNRYAEELAVTRAAAAAARARGWLPADAGDSPAVRRNLLVDAFADLDAGEAAVARQKLAFLRAQAPALARHATVRAFAALSRLGAPGRSVLRAGLRLVARGNGRP